MRGREGAHRSVGEPFRCNRSTPHRPPSSACQAPLRAVVSCCHAPPSPSKKNPILHPSCTRAWPRRLQLELSAAELNRHDTRTAHGRGASAAVRTDVHSPQRARWAKQRRCIARVRGGGQTLEVG